MLNNVFQIVSMYNFFKLTVYNSIFKQVEARYERCGGKSPHSKFT